MVLLAEDELGAHIRPRIQWPGRVPDRGGFAAPSPAESFLGQRARYSIVEAGERVIVAGFATVEPGLLLGGLLVAGVGPYWPGLSPGAGIIPASSTSSRAGSWLAARVAVNAP
jgi:hypothetical protein